MKRLFEVFQAFILQLPKRFVCVGNFGNFFIVKNRRLTNNNFQFSMSVVVMRIQRGTFVI